MAKVSIIVPVYNVEQYLRDCLDSIKNQTLQEIEIICVNDGSSDSSGRILDEYAQSDKRFRIIHKNNEGYGKAMNIGMELATAPYIGIVESDDMILPCMYEKLLSLMEETQVDVLKADFYEFYMSENGKIIEYYVPLTERTELESLYEKSFSIKEHEEALFFDKHTWTGLYSKDFLRREQIRHNETRGASYQDTGFWFQTMVKAKRIYFTRQAFYRYRIDNPNCSMLSNSKPFVLYSEYDFIEQSLNRMGDEGESFYKWLYYMKTTDNIGSIVRTADEYKEPLAERIKSDFLEVLQCGYIDVDLYESYWKEKIFDLIASPKVYIEKERVRRGRIEDAVKDYETIILYGAGKRGCQMLQILKERRVNTKVNFFAVTKTEGNSEIVDGIPVKGIEELKSYQEKALVIISVGKKYVQEIENILRERGFLHYINMNELI